MTIMFTLGSHSSCNKINSWLLLHPVFKCFNICFSLNKHSLKKAIDCMFQPVATIVFILGKWHLQVQEKLMRRTLKATSVRGRGGGAQPEVDMWEWLKFFLFFSFTNSKHCFLLLPALVPGTEAKDFPGQGEMEWMKEEGWLAFSSFAFQILS